MADYRDFCGECGGQTNFGGQHNPWCSRARDDVKVAYYAEQTRLAQGFVPFKVTTQFGCYTQVGWKCQRGCGCIVWEPDEHMKNVCTTYEKDETT